MAYPYLFGAAAPLAPRLSVVFRGRRDRICMRRLKERRVSQIFVVALLFCCFFLSLDNDHDDDDDGVDNNGHSTRTHTDTLAASELFTSDFLVSFPMFALANVSVRRCHCLRHLFRLLPMHLLENWQFTPGTGDALWRRWRLASLVQVQLLVLALLRALLLVQVLPLLVSAFAAHLFPSYLPNGCVSHWAEIRPCWA